MGPTGVRRVSRRVTVLGLAALGLAFGAGCGKSDGGNADKPSPTLAVPAAGQPYASRFFELPLTVTPPASMQPGPIDAAGLIAWQASATEDKKIRFMLPKQVYLPGKATAEKPPADYLSYIESLASTGTKLTDTKKIQVDGHPATLLTIIGSDAEIPGSLGCPEQGGDPVDDCFAPQPDLSLRMAVIDLTGKTLLAWSRMPTASPDPAFVDSFEQMLGTVHFR